MSGPCRESRLPRCRRSSAPVLVSPPTFALMGPDMSFSMPLRPALIAALIALGLHTPPAATQPVLRLSVGLADGDGIGASAETGVPVYSAPATSQGGLFQGVGVSVGLTYLAAHGDRPCPPSGTEPRCPRGDDVLVSGGVSIDVFRSGPLAVRGLLGGGAAVGLAYEPDGQDGVGSEARTAGTLSYGAAVAYQAAPRVSVFGQYQRFAIFTGEQPFTGPNGPFSVDLGTETRGLPSVGVGVRL